MTTLQQLIIRNLAVLEQAPEIALEIDNNVMREIYGRVQTWTSESDRSDDWWVRVDPDKDLCKFGPRTWPRDEEQDDYKAYYELGTISEKQDAEYWYYISALTRAVPAEFGISFRVDAQWMTHLVGKGTKPSSVWQKFLATQVRGCRDLEENGFRLVGGALSLPIYLVADDLANAYPDVLSDALAPLDEVLGKLENAHPAINAIVTAAGAHFAPPKSQKKLKN